MISHPGRDKLDWKQFQPAWKNSCLLEAAEVNAVYNRSRAGVILSETEGACWSSTEYLLAGLPVVSTPSQGGRDLFYDDHNSIICEPTVSGVRSAVQRSLAREWSVDAIRSRCIDIMKIHRERFAAHLSIMTQLDGAQILQRSFVNRLLRWFPSDASAIEYLQKCI